MGGVTQASGLSAVGPVVPGQIPGTTTNDNAAAGTVGEFIQSVVGGGAAVPLTTAVGANVTSISLSPGDWDVWGNVAFLAVAATSLTQLSASIGTVAATLGPYNTAAVQAIFNAVVPGANVLTMSPVPQRISLAVQTTIFLVAQAVFTAATLGAYGSISARRSR